MQINATFQKLTIDTLINYIQNQMSTIPEWGKLLLILATLICIIVLIIVINKIMFRSNYTNSTNVSNKPIKSVKINKTDYIIYFFVLPSVTLVCGLIGLLSWFGLF